MKDSMFEQLVLYFPFLATEVMECHDYNDHELIVRLYNGETILYNDDDKTIRNLPQDTNHMTENECRHEFGLRLRAILHRRNMTQMDLSAVTGISQPLISAYASGKKSPSFYNVDRIARGLGCSIDELRYIE